MHQPLLPWDPPLPRPNRDDDPVHVLLHGDDDDDLAWNEDDPAFLREPETGH
jgi:hypothetical protein